MLAERIVLLAMDKRKHWEYSKIEKNAQRFCKYQSWQWTGYAI